MEEVLVGRMRSWIHILATGDFGRWSDVTDQDLTMRVPFAPMGFPNQLVGRESCLSAVRDLWATWAKFSFDDVIVYQTDEPGLVFCTAGGNAVTTSGKRYKNSYVFMTRFRDGKVLDQTEYFDSAPVIRLFSDSE